MDVLNPGSVGNSMVIVVSTEQYEFRLFEQSRYGAAFGNTPMV